MTQNLTSRLALCALTVVSLTTVSLAQAPDIPTTPLTLSDVVNIALANQPNLVSAVASRKQSSERVRQVNADYLPSVTPSYRYQNFNSFGNTTQFVNGSVTTVQASQTTETKQGTVNLNYNLFDSQQREIQARQARQSLRAARFTEQDQRQNVIANAADSYFEALRTAALVTVSESQVTRAKNTLDVVMAQVEAGVAAQKDTYQAQADYLNAEVDLLQARNNAQVAQAQLKQDLGIIDKVDAAPLPLADVTAPTDSTPLTANVSGLSLPSETSSQVSSQVTAAIGSLRQVALRERPDILQGVANLEATQSSASLSRISTGLQTDLSLSASYQFEPETSRSRTVTLSLSYPLFDGGLVRSQWRSSLLSVESSAANLDSLRQQVSVEVEQSYRTLLQARATLPASSAAVNAAQVNYEAALESRKEGVGSIVEVITAQTSLVQAQTNYIQAVYDFYVADARLAQAVGQAGRIGGRTP